MAFYSEPDYGVEIPDPWAEENTGITSTPASSWEDEYAKLIGISPNNDNTFSNASSPSNDEILKSIGYTPGILDALSGKLGSLAKSMFVNKDGTLDLRALGAVGGGLAGLLGANKSTIKPTGYQGKIPQYTAVRNMVTAPQAGKRPGAGGTRYGGDVSYVPKGSVPAGGLASLLGGGAQGNNATPDTTELMPYAQGGLTHGRYLQGDTDGMADEIPAKIGKDQPAALSHGEFVIPADVVSHLGNGNSDAGAQKLYSMMDKIREARTGTKKQGKEINPDKFMPGGTVQHYADGGVTGLGSAANAGVTGTESNLSNWAGDYVTDMLGKGKALSEMPYQEYGGPLTAGASDLQNKAFETAGNLSVPGSVGAAAQTAGDIANKAQGINYAPTQFDNQFKAPEMSAATQFTNQYKAPTPYSNTAFTSGTFGQDQAQQYMNPYLQTSLNPQLAEARRQADITEQQNKAAMTKAGAFGGGRQAILTAEGQRNLGTNLANITGQGYNTAYQNAMSQFNADQARNMQAQQASEQSKQFGANQSMTAAQMMAQYGMSAQQAQEAARQFNQSQAMTGAQNTAQYGQAAQNAAEQSKQFGADFGLRGLNTALQAANTQGNLGISSADLGLRQLQEQERLGATQRGIESEGIAADKAAFEEARANPYKMVQFQQSLLNGLPLAAQNINTAQPSTLQQILAGAGGVAGLFGNKTSSGLTLDQLLSKLNIAAKDAGPQV